MDLMNMQDYGLPHDCLSLKFFSDNVCLVRKYRFDFSYFRIIQALI